MKLTAGMLMVPGEVVWVVSGSRGPIPLPPRIGVAFAKLQPKMNQMLGDLIALRGMPHPPWIAKLAFGKDAH